MNTHVVDRIDNRDTGTFTLRVCPNWDDGQCRCEQADGEPSPGHPMYHYPVDPPGALAALTAQEWADRTIRHAEALEAIGRGGEPADPAHVHLGADVHSDRAELERLRAERATETDASAPA